MTTISTRKRSKRSAQRAPQARTIKLAGNMTIYEAAALKPELLSMPCDGSAIELDLAAVEQIDTAGVQLLLLGEREIARAGGSLRLAGCNEAVRELLRLYNLTELFFGAATAPAAQE